MLGIDICEVERMNEIIGTDKMAKLFSARELDYIRSKNYAPETVAGFFAAKEAFFKALGTGILMQHLLNVEVLHRNKGEPYFYLAPAIINEFHLNTARTELSITHTKQTAAAVAMILRFDTFI